MPTTMYTFGTLAAKWQFGRIQLTSGGDTTITPLILSVLATDYIQVSVRAVEAGAVVVPTALVVKLAFVTPGTDPVSGDWKTGSWTTAVDGTYRAQLLVGPGTGGNVYGRGVYAGWIQVVDNPEIPIEQVGTLQVV